MKKQLALSALTAIIATSAEIKEQPKECILNEAYLDHYVTGCQCKSPKPKYKSEDSTV